MKIDVIDHSPTVKELKIEIDAETIRKKVDEVSGLYAKQATVPGFRKGHAPRSVVKTRYKEEIRGEVLRELVPQAITDAVRENDLSVLGEPDVHLDDNSNVGNFGQEPLTFHAHLEVFPEVPLAEYKGIEAVRTTRPIKEEDVDKVLEGIREDAASLQPVEDRGAEPGDMVTANFNGRFVNEPEAENISVEDVDVELGSERVQPEFTENLTGTRPDDEKTFTVDYPEDFSSKGLAGKKVEYTVKVTAVRRKELPELDDEFAASLGEGVESIAALRDKIREDLNARAKAESDQRLRGRVVDSLVDKHQFEVPKSFVEHQTDHRLETIVRDLVNRGVDPRRTEMDWRGIRQEIRGQAEHDVRASMLIDRIADAENIEASPDEIAAELQRIATASGQSVEQVRAALTKEGGERSIADRLRNRKVLDLLVENARVTDEEWREEPVDEQAVEDDSNSPTGDETEKQSVAAEGGNP